MKKKQIFLLFRGEEEWKRKGRKIIEGKFGLQRRRRTEEEKENIIWRRKSKGRKIFGKGNYFEGREIYKQPKKQLKVQYIGIF